MKEKIKDMLVSDKLKYAFNQILKTLLTAVIVGVVALLIMNMQLTKFYIGPFVDTTLQMEIQKDIQMEGKMVLWSLTTLDTQETNERLENATYYADMVNENIAALDENFDNGEICAELKSEVALMDAAREKLMELSYANEIDDALIVYDEEYAVIAERVQNILNQIDAEADAEAEDTYNFARTLGIICLCILIIMGIIGFFVCRLLRKTITESICEPIEELDHVAKKIKSGELDIDISYISQDEMGSLAESFRETCKRLREVIMDAGEVLSEMADGNFNVHTKAEESYVGAFQALLTNIRKLNRQLSSTLRQINESSEQVNVGAVQMAQSAQSLAEGATEQAGAVEELTATVEAVTNSAKESAEGAKGASELTRGAAAEAQKSSEEMSQLLDAMQAITDTSKEIENIIGAIEDIAEQTNLLSLNASIEAARAGEAGKGFAVVADQIGKLAADSAKSAVMTRELISKSLEEIERGNSITERTAGTIESVIQSMSQFAQTAAAAAEGSMAQAQMLGQVQQGIEQISSVVQSNSASAQQSSAVSEELAAQAENLKELIAKFTLRDNA